MAIFLKGIHGIMVIVPTGFHRVMVIFLTRLHGVQCSDYSSH
jgi:hypothetical protein